MSLFLWCESASSTQDVSKSLSDKDISEFGLQDSPLVAICTRQQFAGRGRGGSEWVQPGSLNSPQATASELTLSSCERFGEIFSDFPPTTFRVASESLKIPSSWVPLMVGCAIIDALQDLMSFATALVPFPLELPYQQPFLLKWPNDVLVKLAEFRKVSGVLCESSFQGQKMGALHIGVGLNLMAHPNVGMSSSVFESFFWKAASSKEKGRKDRFLKLANDKSIGKILSQRFFLTLIKELEEYLFVDRSRGQLRGLALERSMPRGMRLVVNKGERQGAFAGLDLNGGLLLADQSLAVQAGDVVLVPPPVSQKERLKKFLTSRKQNSELKGSELIGSELKRSELKRSELKGSELKGSELLLVLEIGNTRIHAQSNAATLDSVRDSQRNRVQAGASFDLPWSILEEESDDGTAFRGFKPLFSGLISQKQKSVRVVYTSVAPPKKTHDFLVRLEKFFVRLFPEGKWHTQILDAKVLLAGTPLVEQYQLSTLGADRALRLLHCWKEASKTGSAMACLSLGTATTLECVDPDGKILESWICAGIESSLHTLHGGTARLPLLNNLAALIPAVASQIRPCTTEQSLANGVLLPISNSLKVLVGKHHIGRVYLSGGNAKMFASYLRLEHQSQSNSEPSEESDEESDFFSCDELLERKVLWDFCSQPNVDVDADAVRERSSGGRLSQANRKQESLEITETTETSEAPESLEIPETAQNPENVPWDAMLQSMRRGRVVRSQDLTLVPERKHFRRLGVRLEGIVEGKEPRLDRYLSEKFRFHNRATWQQRVLAGEVLVQSNAPQRHSFLPPEESDLGHGLRQVKDTYRLKNHDLLWLFHPPEYEPDFVDNAEVIYDDGDAIVFSKPGNLVVHASGLYGKNTFVDVIQRMGHGDAAAVHRLDRETSGVLVCARTTELRSQLALAFRESRMKKMYLAVTKSVGGPSESLTQANLNARIRNALPRRFMVRKTIGPAINSRIRLKLWTDPHPDSQEAATAFERLSSFEDYSLWACFPVTGRTNQIRIHLASVGEWIVGDKMYHPNEDVFITFYEDGLTDWVLEQVLCPRHLLHNAGAQPLDGPAEFPIFGKAVTCSLPPDFVNFGPVSHLLERANLPLDPTAQALALEKLFVGFCWSEIQSLETVE